MVGDIFFESLLKKLKEADKRDYQSICDSFLDSQVDSVMQARISCIDTVEKNFRDGLQKFLAHQDSIWYDVFSLSQSMYQIAVDSSKEFSDYYRTSLEPSKRASLQHTFIALEQIHGRACQEFLEILYLMRLGFPCLRTPASTRLLCQLWQSGCMGNSARSKTVFLFICLKQPASTGCSSRFWVFPTSILQSKISRCIYVCIACGCYEASQRASQI